MDGSGGRQNQTGPVPGFAVTGLSAFGPDAPDLAAVKALLSGGTRAIRPATADDLGLSGAALFDPQAGVVDRCSSFEGAWIGTGAPPPDPDAPDRSEVLNWPLHLARKALADAQARGAPVPERARIGVICGMFSWGVSRDTHSSFLSDYTRILSNSGLPDWSRDPPLRNGRAESRVADDIARLMGLGGPCLSMEAACATGLYALSMAQLYIRAGKADAMLVVAASSVDPVFASLGFSALQAIPSNGAKSLPMDAETGGLALGQGGVGCLIQPATAARGSHVVVRGIGLASDGRGQHLVAPNPKGQTTAIKRAYAETRIELSSIDWIEAHATGTSLGDATEMSVLAGMFGEKSPPIGASKAVLGHWLTASGLLGLVKAVDALEQGKVPATPGIGSAIDPRVIQRPMDWAAPVGDIQSRRMADAKPRRMAIDSFGFGGTNAHAILQEPSATLSDETDAVDLPPSGDLAVLGMEAIAGDAVGLADVIAMPRAALARPLGALNVDAMRLRKSPLEISRLSPAAPLMQAVADAALQNAGIAEGGRVAVIVAMEADLAVHRLMARWKVQAAMGQTLAPAELEQLKSQLAPATDAAAFLGWIGNLLASRITQAWDFSGPNLTVSSGLAGAGRALELAEMMLQAGQADAVLIGAVGLSSGLEARLAAGHEAAVGDPDNLGADGAAAMVVTLPDSELAKTGSIPRLNVAAAMDALSAPTTDDCIAGPLIDLVRRLGAAQAGRRADATSPLLPDTSGVLHVPSARVGGGPLAMVQPRAGLALGPAQAVVLPFAVDQTGWSDAIDALERSIGDAPALSGDWLRRAAHTAIAQYRRVDDRRATVALVARTPQELQKEIARARTGAPKAITNGTEWTSPLGSVATGAPVGDQPVAFLYTGLSMLPVGAGADFFAQAPEAAAQMARHLGGLDDAPAFARLFPAQDPSPEQAERLARDLASDPAALLWATPILASLACASVSALLGRGPRFCVGHSLGEIGMMVSHGYWRADTRWQDRLATDATLLSALSGPKTAVTKYLGVENADTWDSRLLMTDAARVASALRNLPEALAGTVWISHCNTPSETIICGMGDAVDALARAVGADSVAGPPGPVIHCPPVALAADGLKALLSALHVQTPADPPTLFFAAEDMPFEPGDTRPVAALSDVVVDGFARRCDAPVMIERLYAAGARVFIELGPTTGFARWTKATLGDRPHLAVPSDRRGGVPGHGSAALTARLLAHNVPLDLERLHQMMGQDLSPLRSAAKLPVPIVVDPHPLGQSQIAPPQAVAPKPVETAAKKTESAPAPTADQAVDPRARIAQAHRAFLASRRRALAGSGAPAPEIAPPAVLYDATAVRAFADGQLAQVLGREGAWIDTLPRRIRVPAPPFMALDRVMLIERPTTGLAPARIVTEHDIPHGAGVDIDGQPPYLALDAQGILLLFSVMGYDRMLEGKRVYRWLDATLTYRGDAPRCGDTVRYDITVNRIVEDGSDLMVFADFRASVGGKNRANNVDRTVLEITNCAAGFFSDAALDGGQGLKPVTPQRRADSAAQPDPRHRAPQCGRIDRAGLAHLAAGNVAAVIGDQSAPGAGPNRLRLPPETMWMIDRVTGWDLGAGAPDLGVFEAEKDLDPSHWYLKAHFVDDPVFAGPCMIEGALQLLRIAALAHGLGAGTTDARFEPVADAALAVKFRSQVRGDRKSVFTYKLTVTGIGRAPVPWIVADVDLIHQGRITGRLSGLALQIVCGQDTTRWQPGKQGAQTKRTRLEHA